MSGGLLVETIVSASRQRLAGLSSTRRPRASSPSSGRSSSELPRQLALRATALRPLRDESAGDDRNEPHYKDTAQAGLTEPWSRTGMDSFQLSSGPDCSGTMASVRIERPASA